MCLTNPRLQSPRGLGSGSNSARSLKNSPPENKTWHWICSSGRLGHTWNKMLLLRHGHRKGPNQEHDSKGSDIFWLTTKMGAWLTQCTTESLNSLTHIETIIATGEKFANSKTRYVGSHSIGRLPGHTTVSLKIYSKPPIHCDILMHLKFSFQEPLSPPKGNTIFNSGKHFNQVHKSSLICAIILRQWCDKITSPTGRLKLNNGPSCSPVREEKEAPRSPVITQTQPHIWGWGRLNCCSIQRKGLSMT